MDESGFRIGESQTIRVLIYLNRNQRHKIVGGKQEWITDIKYISAAGESLPPILIFKDNHLSSGWIPKDAPSD